MNPKVRAHGLITREIDGVLHIEDTERATELSLDPLARFVWQQADGSRTVADLAAGASESLGGGVSREDVWCSLDWLADNGLMEQRVAPPAGRQRISRREVLHKVLSAPVFASAAFAFAGPLMAATKEQKAKSKVESKAKKNDKKTRKQEAKGKKKSVHK